MSFGGVTWFALLPFSMQGTLSASVPAKQTSRSGQGARREAHRGQAGHCLSSHRAQPHAERAAGLRHNPTTPSSAAPPGTRAGGIPAPEVAGEEDGRIPAIKSWKPI